MRRFYGLLLLLLPIFGFSQILSDKAEVSLLTVGNGNELYALYGHTALRIADPVSGIDAVYNYGSFDFTTPNFGLRFVKGDLQYFASVGTFNDFLYSYQLDRRSVTEQKLNFPQEKKQQLFQHLNSSLKGPDRFYTYKFIDRNCTTMVMDILNEQLGSALLKKVGNKQVSYRDIIYPGFDGHFFEKLGVNLFFGPKTDRPAEQLFLPIELWESVNAASYRGNPLLKENVSWLQFDEPEKPVSLWNNPVVYVLFLGLLVFWRNRILVLTYFSVAALLGIFFCFAGWYSFHEELQWNYNALLINPLLLGVVVAHLRTNDRQLFFWCGINLLCLAIYLGVLITKVHLLIVLPLVVSHLIILLTWALQARKRLKKA